MQFYAPCTYIYIHHQTLLSETLDELHRENAKEREHYKNQVEELKSRCQEKQEMVELEHTMFMEFKEKTALSSVNSRSGKPIPQKVSLLACCILPNVQGPPSSDE